MAKFQLQLHSPEKVGEELEGSERGREPQRLLSIMAGLVGALKKSLVVTCKYVGEEAEEEKEVALSSMMNIGWPTDVRHIAHVTFDRFHGFLGLPVELQPDVPTRAPSASKNVFGVSPQSMQCKYDERGNSVPVILLSLQKYLYLQGGLHVEGIFRVNAENSQELHVRDQLNKGVVPREVDAHCLAGLIKAWFRELPTGVLDKLTSDQVMSCITEEDCSQLASLLPPMEAALLDWAVNLMADVAHYEYTNKMNARSIAMVFAPNMTKMGDPLIALIHVVHVMNFLKTLVIKTMGERWSATEGRIASESSCRSTISKDEHSSIKVDAQHDGGLAEKGKSPLLYRRFTLGEIMMRRERGSQCGTGESFCSTRHEGEISCKSGAYGSSSSIFSQKCSTRDAFAFGKYNDNYNVYEHEGLSDGLRVRKGARKLCWHPLFQSNNSVERSVNVNVASSNGEGREAWA